MKRKLLLALIALTCALCLIFALAGCNPAENQSGGQHETPGGQGSGGDDKSDTHNYIFKCRQTEHWKSCTDCGEETAHTPHSVSDGVCPACGYVEKCTQGLKFEEIKENEEIIGYEVSIGTATDSHIFIPSFYNNLPVISIGASAFEDCYSLESVTIGNSVTFIGEGAFWYCESLKEITIPDSVTSIGDGAFGGCINLTEIFIPASVTSIGSDAFESCESLKGVYINDLAAWCNIDFKANPLVYAHNLYLKGQLVTNLAIPNGVTAIKEGAFYGYTSLKEITIPNSVTSIDRIAFYFCTSLKEITIPNSVTSIGESAFFYCTSLTEITIPDSVTSIGDYAFACCENLTEINILKSVTSIGDGAFSDCTSLTEINIPKSVTSIGRSAFSDCTSLERVIFENTEGWKVSQNSDMSNSEDINVKDPEQNAENFEGRYCWYYWKRGE